MGVAEELEDWEEEYGTQVAILEQKVSSLKIALTDKSKEADDGRVNRTIVLVSEIGPTAKVTDSKTSR